MSNHWLPPGPAPLGYSCDSGAWREAVHDIVLPVMMGPLNTTPNGIAYCNQIPPPPCPPGGNYSTLIQVGMTFYNNMWTNFVNAFQSAQYGHDGCNWIQAKIDQWQNQITAQPITHPYHLALKQAKIQFLQYMQHKCQCHGFHMAKVAIPPLHEELKADEVKQTVDTGNQIPPTKKSKY